MDIIPVGLIAIVITLIVIAMLALAILRKISTRFLGLTIVRSTKGQTPFSKWTVRIMSIGVATLLVPEVASNLLFGGISFVLQVSQYLPRIITDSAREAYGYVAPFLITRISEMLANTFFSNPLSSLSVSRIALFAILWTASHALISGNPPAIYRFVNWYKQKAERRENRGLVLAILLFISGYLSITSVIAIPRVQESSAITNSQNSPGISPATLQNDLIAADSVYSITLNYELNWSSADTISATAKKLDDFQKITIGAMQKGITTSLEPESQAIDFEEIKSRANEYSNRLKEAGKQRESLAIAYAKSSNSAQNMLADLRSRATKSFELGFQTRNGKRETAKHYQLITDWYSDKAGILIGQLSNCAGLIDITNNAHNRLAESIANWIQQVQTGKYLNVNISAIDELQPTYQSVCPRVIIDATNPYPPSRPSLGSDLGVFSSAASWLLLTESLPLALLVGLIGFGLLGATCASFIRREYRQLSNIAHSSGPYNALDESDFTGIVIRGFTAAVVVFLAVEGGLSVFSVTESSPNPYVLLLTCLTAAVFSERVWEWAAARMQIGEAKQPEAKQPETKQPEAKQPEARQPEAKQPAVSLADQPSVDSPLPDSPQ